MNKTKPPLCNQISRRKLLDNKMRNLCIIIAVVLTTVLFTTTFSSIFYFRNNIRTVELEKIGWTAHGAVAEVTNDQYEIMKRSSSISDISYYTHLGFMQESDQSAEIEIQYCENTMASWMYYNLMEGHMPDKNNELVVSSQFLKNKGLNFTEGMKLKIKYSINGKIQSNEFILSGVYDYKATALEVAFVSKSFLNKALDKIDGEEILDSALGLKVVEVLFPNTRHMEQYMKKFLKESNSEQNKWILNEVYLSGAKPRVDIISAVLCVLILIMLCGYLIIYNIYYISVMQDTRFYGSLVTLGFCEEEIYQIVKSMTNILCAIAIPIGLVFGYIFSISLLPKVVSMYGYEDVRTLPDPLIFIFAAIFSYLTVRISSKKPSVMATKISPIEAKNYIDINISKKKILKKNLSKNKSSKNSSRLYVIAWKNAMRERKKAIMICSSISLCIILTSLFYSVSRGVNMNLFLKDVISCDFILGSEKYFNKVGGMYTSLDYTVPDSINQWDGIIASGGACVTTLYVPLDDKAFTKFSEIVGKEGIKKEHTMISDVYGVDDMILQKISVKEGELDLEKLRTGNYIVAGCFVESQGTLSCYDIGDKVKVVFDNGEVKEYTVLAIGDIPYELSMREHYAYSASLYLPSEEWKNQMETEDYYVYAYDVKADFETTWDSNMTKLIQNESELSYESKMTYKKQLEGYINGILMLGICVSIILGVIGLLNFVNSIYTSIHNRKRELAIMQSMGMSKYQIYGSLIIESGYYLVISLAVGTVVGVILSYLVVTSLGNAMEFIQYKWSMLPYIGLGIIGCIIALCIPVLIFYTLDTKEDLLYRLHKKA